MTYEWNHCENIKQNIHCFPRNSKRLQEPLKPLSQAAPLSSLYCVPCPLLGSQREKGKSNNGSLILLEGKKETCLHSSLPFLNSFLILKVSAIVRPNNVKARLVRHERTQGKEKSVFQVMVKAHNHFEMSKICFREKILPAWRTERGRCVGLVRVS